MAYSEAAIARRRCTARTRAGAPCRAWACWDDPQQRCVIHAGRGHRGPQHPGHRPYRRARYPAYTCPAYQWPHRPGAGLCRWPDPPARCHPTPAVTHRATFRRRWRRRSGRYGYERR